ncbi:HSF-DOMAIN domain-containing protein [Mycena chlorophos]|uniref:HSF-DOMAIN domain-containing protein n=1 Tax=Mycena chlorophos TaxID=658473 RepID=A0A8H6SCX6_MYCCL|nr:HSF-DOMAIN domain-containing protein [Mycena chlorophos]
MASCGFKVARQKSGPRGRSSGAIYIFTHPTLTQQTTKGDFCATQYTRARTPAGPRRPSRSKSRGTSVSARSRPGTPGSSTAGDAPGPTSSSSRPSRISTPHTGIAAPQPRHAASFFQFPLQFHNRNSLQLEVPALERVHAKTPPRHRYRRDTPYPSPAPSTRMDVDDSDDSDSDSGLDVPLMERLRLASRNSKREASMCFSTANLSRAASVRPQELVPKNDTMEIDIDRKDSGGRPAPMDVDFMARFFRLATRPENQEIVRVDATGSVALLNPTELYKVLAGTFGTSKGLYEVFKAHGFIIGAGKYKNGKERFLTCKHPAFASALPKDHLVGLTAERATELAQSLK